MWGKQPPRTQGHPGKSGPPGSRAPHLNPKPHCCHLHSKSPESPAFLWNPGLWELPKGTEASQLHGSAARYPGAQSCEGRTQHSPAGSVVPLCLSNSPIYDKLVVGGRFVAHWAHPGRLLLIHLEVEDGIEALQVGTGLRPAGHRQPHLHQLG